ncbi:hypothetical protein FO519_005992 [Halicephalobus sp. NKZ332]|nr:hypothetical protein FO519_005992 [Halicephalobus sp. NKZ332]
MGRKAKLVAIGAFDPPTFFHMRMFERAKEYLEQQQGYEIVEGIISIIPDTFRSKNCNASCQHRMAMLKRILRENRWIRPDNWQCSQSPQLCLPQILSYIDSTFNVDRDGIRISTIFLCNDQFFEHVSVDEFDYCTTLEFQQVLQNFTTIVVCPQGLRTSTSSCTAVTITENKTKLYIVHDDVCSGPISGKKVRKALEQGDSIRYCTEDSVISYIYEHGLYCRQYPPLPLKKKSTKSSNPWKLMQKETDLMSCSLPSTFLEKQLLPFKEKSFANSDEDLLQESEPISSSRSQVISKKLSKSKLQIRRSDPSDYKSLDFRDSSVYKLPKTEDPSVYEPSKTNDPSVYRLSKTLDPSVYKSSKMLDPSVEHSPRACSTISFTFEQHNLTYTPESTV